VKLSRADESTKIYSNFLFACFFVALRKLEKKTGTRLLLPLKRGKKGNAKNNETKQCSYIFHAAALNKREFSPGNFFLSIFLADIYKQIYSVNDVFKTHF
jgi:hypothetical protein